MDNLRQYIVSIVAVAAISAILLRLVGNKSQSYKLLKLMCGIVMVLAVVAPWMEISVDAYIDYFDSIGVDALSIRETGEGFAEDALRQGIKEQTEAYILDKAALLGADIHVSVTCDTSLRPVSVRIRGNASPYVKRRLQEILCSDIGISEENQTWT